MILIWAQTKTALEKIIEGFFCAAANPVKLSTNSPPATT